MKSIYQTALGPDFEKLHPQIQKRFGFSSQSNTASVGTGTMDRVWHGKWYTLPFLWLGTWRNIMFPSSGKNIPFTIQNYAYLDSFGRETVTWVRTFFFKKRPRRFDATMIYSQKTQRVVDYLGTHQHLAVDINVGVDPNGGIRIRSGAQRFYEGPIAFVFPKLFTGSAEVCEWYDDTEQKFKIDVEVKNEFWGPLFGYSGTFDAEFKRVSPDAVPTEVKPLREERRE